MTDNERLREAIATLRQDVAMWTGRVGAAAGESANRWKLVLDCAESLLPKTKMVEVWHVHYAARTGMGEAAIYTPMLSLYQSEAQARETAANATASPMYYCVKVTGPHQQEIPV